MKGLGIRPTYIFKNKITKDKEALSPYDIDG